MVPVRSMAKTVKARHHVLLRRQAPAPSRRLIFHHGSTGGSANPRSSGSLTTRRCLSGGSPYAAPAVVLPQRRGRRAARHGAYGGISCMKPEAARPVPSGDCRDIDAIRR